MCRTATGGQQVRCMLAQRGPFRVDQCGCGTVHLTIGAVSIRLLPLACAELAMTLLKALEQLHPTDTAGRAH